MPARSFESTRSSGARLRVSDYVVETETDIELVNGELRVAAHAGPLQPCVPGAHHGCLWGAPHLCHSRARRRRRQREHRRALLHKGNPVLLAYLEARYRAGEVKGEKGAARDD